MIEIAGGILLAVFILALLSGIFSGLSWAFVAAVLLAMAGGAAWWIWTGAQSIDDLITEFTTIKARGEKKAELDA